ncbi:hypothetical protein JCM15831A_17070 [Asaia astilbis]
MGYRRRRGHTSVTRDPSKRQSFDTPPTLTRFFRLYTQIWRVFFLIRSSVLLFLATTDQQSHWIGILLKVGLVTMILLSFKGRALYRLYAACFDR